MGFGLTDLNKYGTAQAVNAHVASMEKQIAELTAERDELKHELVIAVEACCNQYWDDGHGARVKQRWGIDEKTFKGQA